MSESNRLKEIIKILNKNNIINDKSPKNIRIIFEQLGPIYVKIGQILSNRNDFLSKEYRDEFKKLLNSATPVPFKEIISTLESEYEDYKKIFKTIDEKPLGSASIAQTHRAKLVNGKEVAIKVVRNGIKETVSLDLKLFKKIIKQFHLDKLISSVADIDKFVDDLSVSIMREMDLLSEAKNIDKFSSLNQNINYIKTIKVYHEYTTKNVLVMEYVDGDNIDNTLALKKKGYDIDEIAKKLANNYVKQAIGDGFYHADPHASNIKIKDGKIVYLDFGMMGTLSLTSKKQLEKCIEYIINDNYREIAAIVCMMNTNNKEVDFMKLCSDIKKVLEKNKTTAIESVDIKLFINDMYDLFNSSNIVLPSDITMLLRGIIIIAGLLEEICPDINLITVFRNYYFSNLSEYINSEKINNEIISAILNVNSLVNIPNEMLSTLKSINNDEMTFNVKIKNSDKLNDTISTFNHQFIIAMINASFIIGLAILVNNSNSSLFLTKLYFICSSICTIYLIYKIIFNKISRK